MKLIKASYKILPHLDYFSMLRLICEAAAVCYASEIPKTQKEQERYIAARVSAGHESVIEHVGFSVKFTVDRGITHELVRHRVASFTQSSTRFQNYASEKFAYHVPVVMPPFVSTLVPEGEWNMIDSSDDSSALVMQRADNPSELVEISLLPGDVSTWLFSVFTIGEFYGSLLAGEQVEAGSELTKPEMARYILPNATAAEIVMTANMREWRHIFRLRALGTTGRPHPQMQEVMFPLLQEAKTRFPVFFADL